MQPIFVVVLKTFEDKYTGEVYLPGCILVLEPARAEEILTVLPEGYATVASLPDGYDIFKADDLNSPKTLTADAAAPEDKTATAPAEATGNNKAGRKPAKRS